MFVSLNVIDFEIMKATREEQSRSFAGILRFFSRYGSDNMKNNRI
jgi:hypothetical protein